MRKIFFAGLLAALSFSAFTVSAQENGNRDSLNRIVRGPYETNRFGDNWFIGVAGGINLPYDGGHKTRVSPSVDVTVGKWFTPSVGARIGYNGFRANTWAPNQTVVATELNSDKNMYKEKVNYAFAHADLLWNISHAFSGYKETRFWNFIPYATFGFMHAYGTKDVNHKDNEFAAGAGLLNNLRLCDRVNLTLDARAIVVKGTFNANKGGIYTLPSLTVGVSVNLGKTNWKRATVIPDGHSIYPVALVNGLKDDNSNLKKDNAAKADEINALKKDNAAKAKRIEELENAPKGNTLLDVTEAAVFFNIGETKLDSRQLDQLKFYVDNVINQSSDEKIILTGYADKQTGTKKRNQQLKQLRTSYVSDILVKNYGVDADRVIVVETDPDTCREGYDDPVLNRAVTIKLAK